MVPPSSDRPVVRDGRPPPLRPPPLRVARARSTLPSMPAATSVDPDATTERRELDDRSWVDVTRGWLRNADDVYAALTEAHRSIQHRYRVTFGGVGLAFYRDGRDSVAFHRDTDLRYCENTVIAILSLGARRPWLLQPRGNPDRFRDGYGGQVIDLAPASGDLIVLGGACQINWLHAVPKVPGPLPAGRVSAQWRWTSRTGKPEQQPSYSAPRHFSRGSPVLLRC